jgi:hypothetical protein
MPLKKKKKTKVKKKVQRNLLLKPSLNGLKEV